MLNITLNIIGIILIIYSIFVIKKDIDFKDMEENKSKEIKNINPDNSKGEFYQKNFDKIVYQKIQKKEIEDKEIKKEGYINEYDNIIIKEEIISEANQINPLHKKITELKNIGLDNYEIAKKLGKGIREIEIIIKVYKL